MLVQGLETAAQPQELLLLAELVKLLVPVVGAPFEVGVFFELAFENRHSRLLEPTSLYVASSGV